MIVSVLLALVPVTLVYGFSVRFLRANINSYFDLEIERTLDDALELARASLDLQMRTLQRDTLQVADELVGVDDSVAVIVLNTLTADTDASEMTLIGPDNRIVASTGLLDDITVQPDRPDDDLIARARQGLSYVGVDPGRRRRALRARRRPGALERCRARSLGAAGALPGGAPLGRSRDERAVELPAVPPAGVPAPSADGELRC